MIRLGLVGYPLDHSLSPALQHAALAEHNLPGSYRLYPLAPGAGFEARFTSLLQDMRRGRLSGLNVTIPHKQAVIPYLDDLTPQASQVAAVNTIYLEGGRVVGDNTDSPGFYYDLCRELGFDQEPASGSGSLTALVLGAGGAARAVVHALARNTWSVWIAARRTEQAQQLHSDLQKSSQAPAGLLDNPPQQPAALFSQPAGTISIIAWQHRLSQAIHAALDLVVNATPVGMWPQVEQSPWPEERPWPERAFLYDLVYNPPNTRLVRQARAAGLQAVSGAGMLVEQAALAFERWTGRPAPRERMRQVVVELL